MVANKEFAYQWKSLWLGKHNNYFFFRFIIIFSNSFTNIIHKLNSIIHLSYQESQTFYCCHLILICLLYALFFRSLFGIMPISYSHMLLTWSKEKNKWKNIWTQFHAHSSDITFCENTLFLLSDKSMAFSKCFVQGVF